MYRRAIRGLAPVSFSSRWPSGNRVTGGASPKEIDRDRLPIAMPTLAITQFQALADFRYLLRGYLNGTEKACHEVGLEPLHYNVLLQLVGLPMDEPATVGFVAKRLFLKHHSAVELIDRMEKQGLVRRARPAKDRRFVEVHVTPSAKALLKRLVKHRIEELGVVGPALARSIEKCFRSGARRRMKATGSRLSLPRTRAKASPHR
jgi:DNA-binding MarR family transcriptional regulator